MSLDQEIEDSLQACREIEQLLSQNLEVPEIHETRQPNPAISQERKPEPETEWKPELEPEPEEFVSGAKEESFEEPGEKVTVNEQAVKPEGEEAERENRRWLKTVLSIAICMFTALILSLLITKFVAHHTSVEGSSMEPSLSNGDQIIVENVSYYLDEPERFDVIVFPNKDGVNYVKRIIGLPEEAVWIYDGQIYINGELLIEEYGSEPIEDPGLAAGELTLGKDEYFVLGDNRNASIDSRQEAVGTVKRDEIKGKAWFRFYPFKKMGTIGS